MEFIKVARNLIICWFISLVAAILSKSIYVSLFSVGLTGLMPFILAILWLGLSDTGKSIIKRFEAWHIKIFWLSVIFLYGLLGRKWAGDVINQIFGVDSGHFGLTSTMLTVLFTPFGILYRHEFINDAFNFFTIVSILIIPYYIIYLLFSYSIKKRWRKIAYMFVGLFLTSAAITMANNLSRSFYSGVKLFAIWADFNDSFLCTDSWVTEGTKILYLDSNLVLVYNADIEGPQFSVEQCNNSKRF